MLVTLIVMTEVYLGVKIIETVLNLCDRLVINKIAKDLANQLEEESYGEENKGKHSID